MKTYETNKILKKMWKYSVNNRTSEGIVIADDDEDALSTLLKLYNSYDSSAIQSITVIPLFETGLYSTECPNVIEF